MRVLDISWGKMSLGTTIVRELGVLEDTTKRGASSFGLESPFREEEGEGEW